MVERHPTGFLIDEPASLLERGLLNKVPLIIGTNQDEGAYFYPRELLAS